MYTYIVPSITKKHLLFPSGRKLFGPGYSGLEYDYRGLLRLYHNIGSNQKAMEYGVILHHWNQIRDANRAEEKKPLDFEQFEGTEDIIQKFFEMS